MMHVLLIFLFPCSVLLSFMLCGPFYLLRTGNDSDLETRGETFLAVDGAVYRRLWLQIGTREPLTCAYEKAL